MSSKQTLQEIKKVEAEAQRMVEMAREEKEKILERGRLESEVEIKREEENFLKQKEQVLKTAAEEAKKIEKEILKDSEKEVANVAIKAQGKIETAADFVVKKILNEI